MKAVARAEGRETGVYRSCAGRPGARPRIFSATGPRRRLTGMPSTTCCSSRVNAARPIQSLSTGCAGHWCPDDVAEYLPDIAAAGFEGIGFSFLNYLDELPFYAQEVLPRLHRQGLRAS